MLHDPADRAARDPIPAVLAGGAEAVLAIIAGVEGPSYRPVGTVMAVLGPEARVGSLSSGCVEADITLHALEARAAGVPRLIRYGRGSPIIDIQLPCGGGLEILLLPRPDRAALEAVVARLAERRAATLEIDMQTGAMGVLEHGATEREGQILRVRFAPAIRFLVFGKGPEASTFAALVEAAGYPNLLLSPDPETLAHGAAAGCATRPLAGRAFPADLDSDGRTAVTLFFHDHDWEPPILAGALETPAFYIGAQGSVKARDARLLALEAMGVDAEGRARLRGPVGLIPSARDPNTLAVSVLAEVLAEAMADAG